MSRIFISYLRRGLSDLQDVDDIRLLLRRLRARRGLFAARAGEIDELPGVAAPAMAAPQAHAAPNPPPKTPWRPPVVQLGIPSPDSRRPRPAFGRTLLRSSLPRLKTPFMAGAGRLVALAGLCFLFRPAPAGAAQDAVPGPQLIALEQRLAVLKEQKERQPADRMAAAQYAAAQKAAIRDATARQAPAMRTGQTKIAKDGLTYVWIEPGTFTMGCSPGDSECPPNERPAHEVRITAGFWMGQTDVTQLAWRQVKGTDPSYFKGAQLPVETVNWSEAQSYCQALGMRLPTEAEWEYAARAGSTGSRYGDISRIAWFSANSGGKTHEVMQKQPNAWGLYDMLGNVWQWTADWYADKYSGNAETDPHGPGNGQYRAMRGGSWYFDPAYVRASFRSWLVPEFRLYDVGFRCLGN